MERQESLLIVLMKRLLFDRYAPFYGDESPSEPLLLPGSIPNALPVEVPLPPQSRVIGSMVAGKSATIVFDTDLSQEDLQQYFDSHAKSQGWWQPDMRHFGGGGGFDFVPMREVMGNSYCVGMKGRALSVRMQIGKPDPAGVTGGYLWVNDEGPNSWCNQEEPFWPRRADDLLPTLRPPEGAQQFGGGSGGGGEMWDSKATLVTTLPLDKIAPHYNEQLNDAGWEQTSGGQVEVAAWSEWRFSKNEIDYSGQFFILKLADQEALYNLTLLAIRRDASRWAVLGSGFQGSGFIFGRHRSEGGTGSPWHLDSER